MAERALAIDPKDAAARIALAGAALEQKDIATAEMAVSALVQDRSLGPVNRTFAFSLAGDILDAQDRTAEAFAAYAASKAIQRDAFLPSIEGVERVLARETRLADYFRADRRTGPARSRRRMARKHMSSWSAFPRSGTTLLEQVLASHPRCRRDGRASLPDRFGRGVFSAPMPIWTGWRHCPMPNCSPGATLYWKRVARNRNGALTKPVFLDKMPLNAVFLPLIARLFPNAKILLALRDPRDVVLSCFRRRFAMNAGMYEFTELENTAAYYEAVMDLDRTLSRQAGAGYGRSAA